MFSIYNPYYFIYYIKNTKVVLEQQPQAVAATNLFTGANIKTYT